MNMFSGLSAFPITPIDEDGHLDKVMFANILEPLVDAGVSSVGLLGSTGAFAYLHENQRKNVLEVAVDIIDGRIPIIVGVGAMRTSWSEDLARHAEQAGAQALLLPPMSYQPLVEEEVYHHFENVASSCSLPLCVYNNPRTTKFNFSHQLIGRLAQLPTIQAIKMPLPNAGSIASELHDLRKIVSQDFAVGYSGDWGAHEALKAGAACWYSVVAGVLPYHGRALVHATEEGNHTRAQIIDDAFAPLWALFQEKGSYRVVFGLVQVLGLGSLNPLRPILPLGHEDFHMIHEAVDHLVRVSGIDVRSSHKV